MRLEKGKPTNSGKYSYSGISETKAHWIQLFIKDPCTRAIFVAATQCNFYRTEVGSDFIASLVQFVSANVSTRLFLNRRTYKGGGGVGVDANPHKVFRHFFNSIYY